MPEYFTLFFSLWRPLQVQGVIWESCPHILFCLSQRDLQNALLIDCMGETFFWTIFYAFFVPLKASTGPRSDLRKLPSYTFLFVLTRSTKWTIDWLPIIKFFLPCFKHSCIKEVITPPLKDHLGQKNLLGGGATTKSI